MTIMRVSLVGVGLSAAEKQGLAPVFAEDRRQRIQRYLER